MSLRSLLPSIVQVAETVDAERRAPLHADEAHFVADATDARRHEFALGRALAHEALRPIIGPHGPVGVGAKREPLWPDGTVGSITHCDGHAGAAVGPSGAIRSLGVDSEPAMPLPADVAAVVATQAELARLDGLGPIGRRLLFSAKESVYKAWFPLTGRWLGFEDCDLLLVPIDSATGAFVGRVHARSLVDTGDVAEFRGRYEIGDTHVFTAVVVPVDHASAARHRMGGNRPGSP